MTWEHISKPLGRVLEKSARAYEHDMIPRDIYDELVTEYRRLAKENAWLKHRVRDLDIACMNANRRRAADQQRAAQMAAREQRLREVFG